MNIGATCRPAQISGIGGLITYAQQLPHAAVASTVHSWATDLPVDGKQVIYPSQIEPALRAFRPSDGELEHARRVVEAREEAEALSKEPLPWMEDDRLRQRPNGARESSWGLDEGCLLLALVGPQVRSASTPLLGDKRTSRICEYTPYAVTASTKSSSSSSSNGLKVESGFVESVMGFLPLPEVETVVRPAGSRDSA
jgi:hypothetical protein